MTEQRKELGILSDGIKVEKEELRDIGELMRMRYAHDLARLTREMRYDEPRYDLTPFGFSTARKTYNYMSKLARRGSVLCNLIFINNELLGATYTEAVDSSKTPLPIARPNRISTRLVYQIASPYGQDMEARSIVAGSIVEPEQTSFWQWDIIDSRSEEDKAETYEQLGMIVAGDGSKWISTFDGASRKNKELWAIPPKEDDFESTDIISVK